jgi:small subunit ribosomal protein S18
MPKKTKPMRRIRRAAKKADASLAFSYKQPMMLGKFISEQGSIMARLESGLSQKQQRQLAREVKRARHLALLPFTQTL